ncbi:MAG: hypothetical protein PF961_11410 [Planctomycetota bacterium]|jgi:hypothetical protein|nr:hypothetical protein [Planctomycetota bacterium]
MHIRLRLMSLMVGIVAGVALVAVVSTIAFSHVVSAVGVLVEREMPRVTEAQAVTHTVDNLVLHLAELGAVDANGFESVAEQVDASLTELAAIRDSKGKVLAEMVDIEVVDGLLTQVPIAIAATRERLDWQQRAAAQAAQVNAAQLASYQAVAEVKEVLDQRSTEAFAAVETQRKQAQISFAQTTMFGRTARSVNELQIVIAQLEVVRTRYHVTPLQGRVTAAIDRVRLAQGEAGDFGVTISAFADQAESLLAGDAGLLALRVADLNAATALDKAKRAVDKAEQAAAKAAAADDASVVDAGVLEPTDETIEPTKTPLQLATEAYEAARAGSKEAASAYRSASRSADKSVEAFTRELSQRIDDVALAGFESDKALRLAARVAQDANAHLAIATRVMEDLVTLRGAIVELLTSGGADAERVKVVAAKEAVIASSKSLATALGADEAFGQGLAALVKQEQAMSGAIDGETGILVVLPQATAAADQFTTTFGAVDKATETVIGYLKIRNSSESEIICKV